MNQASIAKISRPAITAVCLRERLFKLLDQTNNRRIVWISGPAGSGKTTLAVSWLDARKLPCIWYQLDEGDGDIASFFYYMGIAAKKRAPRKKKMLPLLTPEYIQGISVFTRRYFEELFSRIKPPSVVILDNYQDVPLDSGFHDMIAQGLDAVPEGITLIILSRLSPPPRLIRFQANNRLHFMGWEDIRFTREESLCLQETQGRIRRSEDEMEVLYRQTEGWAAGLILLMAGPGTAAPAPQASVDMMKGGLFDYFASEIFNKTDAGIKNILLRTSIFQKIDPAVAEKLTGNVQAGQILESLSRDHYFTQKYGSLYQYHPLFREFLVTRMKNSFSADEILQIKKHAAALLEESGQVEDAVCLYREARDWEKLIRLVLTNARSFFIQGRSMTLAEWLENIPPDILNAVPWLLYWKGISKLSYFPDESREFLEQAFRLFEAQGDQIGVFLAWSSIVQTFMVMIDDFRPLDSWINWLDERDRRGISFPSPEIEVMVASGMIGALRWRRPNHPHIKKWVNSSLSASDKGLDVNAYLRACINCEYYYFWVGEFAESSLLIKEMESIIHAQPSASPLMVTMLKTLEALLYNTSVKSNDMAIRSASDGIEIASQTGVHLMDPLLFVMKVISALNDGDIEQARENLARAELAIGNNRRVDSFPFAFLSVWYNLVAGDLQKTLALAKKGRQLAEKMGSPIYESLISLVSALACAEAGEIPDGERFLAIAKEHVLQTGSAFIEYLYHLTEAHFAFEKKNDQAGLDSLRMALAWGRQKMYVSMVFFWRPAILSRLCSKALESGIEEDYVQGFVRELNLVPDTTSPVVENWPWPFKIYTLGRFTLIKDGTAIAFTGKVQQKPLALLKAIIAFGGRDVGVDRITDALWPDAQGDSAHRSFEMALNRLRKLLGDDQIIHLSEGRLTLDSGLCWVDLHHLEQAMSLTETAWTNLSPHQAPDAVALTGQVLALHRGGFLPGEDVHPWIFPVRENVSRRMLRILSQTAMHYEQAAMHDKEIVFLEKGLSFDDLSEEMVQRLMVCNQRLGRKAEAVRLFHQWSDRLASSLGIKPGGKSREIYQSILDS